MADPPEAKRFALKIAYDGTRFFGTNPQPDLRTVSSEFLRAAAKARLFGERAPPSIAFASRTDRGVSALGNCIAIETALEPSQFIPALNQELEDAAVLAAAAVDSSFHPRKASARIYSYALLVGEALSTEPFEEAAQLFVGRHNFKAFARHEKKFQGKPGAYESTIESITAAREGEVLTLTLRGSRFWWNQVRRMVPAIEAYARAECALSDLKRMLEGGSPVRAAQRLAPPEPLTLVDVEYKGLAFERSRAWLRPAEGWIAAKRLEAASTSSFARGLFQLLA